MQLKIFFAFISLLLSLVLFVPYYIGIWRGETKPHLLTWLTWFVLTALGFLLSFKSGGGAGSFTFALQSMLCLLIVIFAFWKKEKNIVYFDWLVFACIVVIVFFYILTKNVLLSVVFAATVDCLGYLPTFRKSYTEPYQEPPLTYFLAFLSWSFSVFALQKYSTTTLFYPLALVLINGTFVIFLIVRRSVIKKNNFVLKA